MSSAALALALAVLIAPVSARHRVLVRQRATQQPSGIAPARVWAQVLSCLAALVLVMIVLAPPGVGAAAAITVVTLALRRSRQRRRRKRTAEAVDLQSALEIVVGELRVGAHPVAAFGVAAREVDGVIGASLRTIAARAQMGADLAAGMRTVASRSSLPEHWERLAVCWRLAQTHGLAIATLMETAQRDIVERERFSAGVNAGMAGARTTAAVLAGLPVIGIGLGQLIGADPLSFLLSGGAGAWLLVIGVALACVGLLWSDRITGQVLR
jgi:tight adherence protein B